MIQKVTYLKHPADVLEIAHMLVHIKISST
jgi:hypothetical protein